MLQGGYVTLKLNHSNERNDWLVRVKSTGIYSFFSDCVIFVFWLVIIVFKHEGLRSALDQVKQTASDTRKNKYIVVIVLLTYSRWQTWARRILTNSPPAFFFAKSWVKEHLNEWESNTGSG